MDSNDETRTKTSSQIDNFKKAARELGCDESEATFDQKIKAIVKKKPSNAEEPTK